MVSDDIARRILEDCRGAVREVRFGFGSKRQLWAFEDRHQLDCSALLETLAATAPAEFLGLAVAFHDEFARVSGAWRARDAIQRLTADACRTGGPAIHRQVVDALIDERLALRHWLVSAFLAAPPEVALGGLENALSRAYQPADQWALLARLQAVALEMKQPFKEETTARLAVLAQHSTRPEDRQRALELLAQFGAAGSSLVLARAARGDADAAVRDRAAELLRQ